MATAAGSPPAPPHDVAGCPDGVCLPLDGTMSLEAMDRAILAKALALVDHNVTAAARLLRTNRQTLRYRIQKHGLERAEDDDAGLP